LKSNNFLRDFFYDPRIKNIQVDSAELLALHKKILNEKVFLRSAFNEFYERMFFIAKKYGSGRGMEVELGSGVGFIKSKKSTVITSDIRSGSKTDRILDAQSLNLSNKSIKCFYAINVLHHLPRPDKFFNELVRTLSRGGCCILIEPHNGFMSSLIHKKLHKDEHFNPHQKSWENNNIKGPMSGANQALAHIIFKRDKDIFKKRYGKKLVIIHQSYVNNQFRYILSGGLNFRQLAPPCLLPLIIFIEKILSPFGRILSLHQITVIIRR
jgi:SAM-dependent methyltransferase